MNLEEYRQGFATIRLSQAGKVFLMFLLGLLLSAVAVNFPQAAPWMMGFLMIAGVLYVWQKGGVTEAITEITRRPKSFRVKITQVHPLRRHDGGIDYHIRGETTLGQSLRFKLEHRQRVLRERLPFFGVGQTFDFSAENLGNAESGGKEAVWKITTYDRIA